MGTSQTWNRDLGVVSMQETLKTDTQNRVRVECAVGEAEGC